MAKNIVETILRIRDEASGPLEQVGENADEAAEGMDGAESSSATLSKGLAVAGAAAIAMGAAILATTQKLADYKNGINDTAVRTGVAADTLIGLQLAFVGSGQSASAMESALGPLPKRLADTARGTGDAQIAFDELGVSVVDAGGDLRGTDEVIRETIAALQDVADPGERAGLAMQAFGRGGATILQALGDADLDVFVRHAQLIGPAFDDAGRGAADFERAMADLELSTLGAADRIANAFGGENGVTSAIDTATDVVIFFGEFTGSFLDARLKTVKTIVREIVAAFDALKSGDITGFLAAEANVALHTADFFLGAGSDTFNASIAAGEKVVAAKRPRRQTRAASAAFRDSFLDEDTDSGGGGGGGGGGKRAPAIDPVAALNGGGELKFKAEADFFGMDLAGFVDPLKMLAEQAAESAEELKLSTEAEKANTKAALEAQQSRDAQLMNATAVSIQGLQALGAAAGAALGVAGAAVTGDAAGAVGGVLSGTASLIATGLDAAAPAIGSAAGAAIGTVVLPVVGTVTGAAIGAVITEAIPILGDVLEGISDAVSQSIGQIVEIGQIGQIGVEQRLADFQTDFIAGLEILPNIIAETLPDFAAEFGVALAEAAPIFALAFAKAIIEATPEIAKARLATNRAFAQSSKDAVLGQRDQFFGRENGIESGISSALGMGRIGSGVVGQNTFNISGVIAENVDRFTEEINSRLGSRGLNLQLGGR